MHSVSRGRGIWVFTSLINNKLTILFSLVPQKGDNNCNASNC